VERKMNFKEAAALAETRAGKAATGPERACWDDVGGNKHKRLGQVLLLGGRRILRASHVGPMVWADAGVEGPERDSGKQ
jgi:hypothetical protein